MDRREKIISEIKKSKKPISATKLAQMFNVSRQIIVGDVALIRASGTNIQATPRGYILEDQRGDSIYTIAVKHNEQSLEDELYTIVDLGGEVIDVVVEHPLYGELTGPLHIKSRYDVDEFIKDSKKHDAKPLSQITDGLHLHHIYCPNEEIYQRILTALKNKGYLF